MDKLIGIFIFGFLSSIILYCALCLIIEKVHKHRADKHRIERKAHQRYAKEFINRLQADTRDLGNNVSSIEIRVITL